MFGTGSLEQLHAFVQGLPDWLHWVVVILVAAVPFLEVYLGAILGIVIGIPAPVAIGAAVIGNIASMAACAILAEKVKNRVRERRAAQPGAAAASPDGLAKEPDPAPKSESRGRARVRKIFERFGVPGVGVLGQLLVPSQFTAPMLVSLGAGRGRVIVWQCVGIVLWGCVFGGLAVAGVYAVS
ncbi:hypothetical protein NQ036_07600 [Brevibacterium sp. 91QC2O2]|jgi:hypothetical protein|uniref:hypothetical protein n=1 Tax=Brevibacterium sp. 91QC2O2 TaxID=2968458 RepID=UPI00211C4B52|nr:hypothetical protein [Brevibacterium sp. 91QC2O2]MCQ9368109.1 hypothetical protein [Brevibacterium sp. 91QC2O2]